MLTGFGITWGIFILIVLLGAGNGFYSGVLNIFDVYASNSIWITGNKVSKGKPEGLPNDAHVKFNNSLLLKLKMKFPQIKAISSEINHENGGAVLYLDRSGYFQTKGIGVDYMNIKLIKISEGRYFNEMDYSKKRHVAIIGKKVKDILFTNKDNAIGKYINISGVSFIIVGIIAEGTIFSMMEQNNIYIPESTINHIFNPSTEFSTIGILLSDNNYFENMESDIRSYLSHEIGFDKEDKNALFINNIQLQVKAFNALFESINYFLWIIGLCFLLSGMIGITNIMFIVVKERTSEIGIRKAIGATPTSIMQLIIMESLIITVSFGIIGIIAGYAGLFCYNKIITSIQLDEQIFQKGHIDIIVIVIALILLILAGLTAGIFPAKNAANIRTIESLK